MLTGNEPVSAANLKAAMHLAAGVGATASGYGVFKLPEIYAHTSQGRIPFASSSATPGASVQNNAVVVGIDGTYSIETSFSCSVDGIYAVSDLSASIELHAGSLSVVLWSKKNIGTGVATGDLSWSSTVAVARGSEVYLLLKYERENTEYIPRIGVENMRMLLSVSS